MLFDSDEKINSDRPDDKLVYQVCNFLIIRFDNNGFKQLYSIVFIPSLFQLLKEIIEKQTLTFANDLMQENAKLEKRVEDLERENNILQKTSKRLHLALQEVLKNREKVCMASTFSLDNDCLACTRKLHMNISYLSLADAFWRCLSNFQHFNWLIVYLSLIFKASVAAMLSSNLFKNASRSSCYLNLGSKRYFLLQFSCVLQIGSMFFLAI